MKLAREKLLPSLFISVLLSSVGLALGYFGLPSQTATAVAAIILLLTFIILLVIYRPLRRFIAVRFAAAEISENGNDTRVQKFRAQLAIVAGMPTQTGVAKGLGVAGLYSSLRECEPRLVELIKTARKIRILTNTGKIDIAHGTRFYDAISLSHAEIQILLAAPDSPFISDDWALAHGFSKEQARVWVNRVKETQREVSHLHQHHHVNITARVYSLPFVWHIWIVDDAAFVTAWLSRSRNVESTRVAEFRQSGPNEPAGLFEMFAAYYDRIWNEQANEYD